MLSFLIKIRCNLRKAKHDKRRTKIHELLKILIIQILVDTLSTDAPRWVIIGFHQ